MTTLLDAVVAGADGAELLRHEVPETYRAAFLRREDEKMFRGVKDKDVRQSIKLGEVPTPELAPDEVLVAVMAAAVNYNTVWSAIFEPMSTFRSLRQYGKQGGLAARHDQDYQVIGSDAAGVVVRVGAAVRHFKVGDKVVVGANHVDEQDPAVYTDGMMGADLRIWGFETNFGSFGHLAVVRATQLMPKPKHLSWEEAASTTLCLATAYRMLISPRGAQIKLGDIVLIWGAAGGLGSYAVQLVREAGGIAVGVASSGEKCDLLDRLGCHAIIDRTVLDVGDGTDPTAPWRSLGAAIRKEVGEDPHVAFEHVGRATFGASVFVVRRGGVVVTCGSSTGFQHSYDNRYLWMKLKRIIGSHGANCQEGWEANRLLELGKLVPTLSTVSTLDDVGEATRSVHLNQHSGKVGVLCLAPEEGLGIEDWEMRERVGEGRLRLFRDHAKSLAAAGTLA